MDTNTNIKKTNPLPNLPLRPSSLPLLEEPRQTFISFANHQQPRPNQNDLDEPLHKMKRTAITLRDVQDLPVDKFVNLYKCIGDLHRKEEARPIQLGEIVHTAWNAPIMIEACRQPFLNEVLYNTIFQN